MVAVVIALLALVGDVFAQETPSIQKPNFLFMIEDQYSYPPPYETAAIKAWRHAHLKFEKKLRAQSYEFHHHYVSSIACAPSRTSLFTGHYPFLHGVSQTDGVAKPLWDPKLFLLEPGTVPTIGNYFRAGGYDTYYKGKWHISEGDLFTPGTWDIVETYDSLGQPVPKAEKFYHNRLQDYGWSDWVGPEPHGADPRNSGASAGGPGLPGRDIVYTDEVVDLLAQLEASNSTQPWFTVHSLMGTHDIVLYGEITRTLPRYNFTPDSTTPVVPQAPTWNDDLSTKPSCQQGYKTNYNNVFQPTLDTEAYRQFYYSMMVIADRKFEKVLAALEASKFANNTVVVFTSDHGDYLGAHGLFQKWFSAYEEATHVPFLIKVPEHLKTGAFAPHPGTGTSLTTSHSDVLPTLLGLAGLHAGKITTHLEKQFIEARPLVGRDLSPLLTGHKRTLPQQAAFITIDDQIMSGQQQISIVTKQPYQSVAQPASLMIVVDYVTDGTGKSVKYKYTRYYDNPMWWANPGVSDGNKTTPVPDQYEMYNLEADPLEQTNLLSGTPTTENQAIANQLKTVLISLCEAKRQTPNNVNEIKPLPGLLPCAY